MQASMRDPALVVDVEPQRPLRPGVPPENSIRRRKPGESASAPLQAVTRTRTDDAHEGVRTPGAEVGGWNFQEAQGARLCETTLPDGAAANGGC